MDIRTFTVGVDGSVPSRAAIRWAVGRAREHDAGVVLVHVADDEGGAVGSLLIDEVDAGAGARLADELAYARSLTGGDAVTAELRSGSPMAVLASYSAGDVMLVLGTHKTGFHYGRAFGSRSLQLANLAVGPVAIVPEAESRLRHGVVVGVDDTPAGYAAVELAVDFACERGCELIAVRSTRAPSAVELDRDDGLRDRQSRRDDEARELLAAVAERARRRRPGITIRSRVVRRPPGVALNEVARSAELLVIGDSRREEPAPGGLGGVAYEVLLNVSSPTIVVHAPPVGALAGHNTEGETHAIG